MGFGQVSEEQSEDTRKMPTRAPKAAWFQGRDNRSLGVLGRKAMKPAMAVKLGIWV